MKRVLTIQDISCLGKCSLTIALPVISAMGTEAVILPTAVLSTHTLFSGFTCKDLSDQILPIARHWSRENIAFDVIYTGYLGTEEEIDTVLELISMFRTPETLVFVDPVMGDNGKLYPAFNEAYARKNAKLCASADVIVPNITEACFMTGMEYRENGGESYLRELLDAACGLGAGITAITGASLEKGRTGIIGFDKNTGKDYVYQNDRVPAAYHGTGDLFASAAVGAISRGVSWQDALRIAADYTAHTIDITRQDPLAPKYGVKFEETLPLLIRTLESCLAKQN